MVCIAAFDRSELSAVAASDSGQIDNKVTTVVEAAAISKVERVTMRIGAVARGVVFVLRPASRSETDPASAGWYRRCAAVV